MARLAAGKAVEVGMADMTAGEVEAHRTAPDPLKGRGMDREGMEREDMEGHLTEGTIRAREDSRLMELHTRLMHTRGRTMGTIRGSTVNEVAGLKGPSDRPDRPAGGLRGWSGMVGGVGAGEGAVGRARCLLSIVAWR
jgi:hypothetical protein